MSGIRSPVAGYDLQRDRGQVGGDQDGADGETLAVVNYHLVKERDGPAHTWISGGIGRFIPPVDDFSAPPLSKIRTPLKTKTAPKRTKTALFGGKKSYSALGQGGFVNRPKTT